MAQFSRQSITHFIEAMTWNALAGFHWLTLVRQSFFFLYPFTPGKAPSPSQNSFRGCSSLGDPVGKDWENHCLLYFCTAEIIFHLKDTLFLSSSGYGQMPFPQGPRAVPWCPTETLSSAMKLIGRQSSPACRGEEIFLPPVQDLG